MKTKVYLCRDESFGARNRTYEFHLTTPRRGNDGFWTSKDFVVICGHIFESIFPTIRLEAGQCVQVEIDPGMLRLIKSKPKKRKGGA